MKITKSPLFFEASQISSNLTGHSKIKILQFGPFKQCILDLSLKQRHIHACMCVDFLEC
jgi:hypothetical protein